MLHTPGPQRGPLTSQERWAYVIFLFVLLGLFAGEVIVIWATGAGVTSVPAKSGRASPPDSMAPAMVLIGGVSATPAYAGLTPGGVGLMQVNVAVPAGIAPGNSVPLAFSIAGNASQTVNVAVR